MFIGRKKEFEYFENLYQKGLNNIVCFYGQKGYGKTSLLLKFSENKNYCYYKCRKCSEDEQLSLFSLEQNIKFRSDPNFSELFNQLNFKVEGKKILIIDEFQHLVKTSDYFIPELVKYSMEQKEGILVILVSSSISFVENALVPKIGEYAQAFSAFYKLNPLTFTDLVGYFNSYSTEDCIKVFSLLGGNPSYWKYFSDKKTVEENIVESVLDEGSYLRNEADNIINEELRESSVYSTILYCLANGMNKLNDLHKHTGFSRAKISVYIKNLMERELVEKAFSFEYASSINSMKGVYRIKNSYLHFYYKYIYKNESSLIILGPQRFFDNYLKDELKIFVDEHFKDVCFEFLSLLNQMERLPIKAESFGEWIGKKGNIDVILHNDDDSLLCFCDWKKEKITMSDYNKYLMIAGESRLHNDYMIIIARGEFDNELTELEKNTDNLQLIRANEL